MADTNQLLEVLQSDVLAVLKATPALALANVISDNEGDIEAKVAKALSTLTATGGKNGLAVVVLLPEITEGEKNLPGPPLTVKLEVRVLENVLLNRAAATGSLIRSSQAALTVLSTLQLRHMGDCLLYADKDPVSPVEVKKGHVSHAVTLFAKFNGFVTPKPLGVTASFEASAFPPIILSGTAGPNIDGVITYAGQINGKPSWNNGLTGAAAVVIQYVGLGDTWYINPVGGGGPVKFQAYKAAGGASTPVGLTGWTITSAGSTGAPVLAEGSSGDVLSLACASPSSTIRYTTDGTFPSPSATLYTTPIPGLATGTVVRAAAYVAGMPPGDVLELTITE